MSAMVLYYKVANAGRGRTVRKLVNTVDRRNTLGPVWRKS